MSRLTDWFDGVGWTVAPFWRVLGAAIAAMLIAAFALGDGARTIFFRIDARLIDQWQRLSPPDAPTGDVVVVGIDAASVREKSRWPWRRADIADLVERIGAAGPRSLTLDFLLTEPGPYADVNLMRAFRQNGPEAIALLPGDEDAALAAAIEKMPVALAVAGGSAEAVLGLPHQTECADPALLKGEGARRYYVECLLFPLAIFDERASAAAVAFADQDLDGMVRRARALVGFPYRGDDGTVKEAFFQAMPLAALTACGGEDPACLSYDPALSFLTEGARSWLGHRLLLTRAEGDSPPPVPLTPELSFWIDFGALPALGPEGTSPARLISAADFFQGDPGAAARVAGKHVFVGLTRLGDVDRHTTPLTRESGTPGVLLQALAADNILAGRALSQPAWGRPLALGFIGMMGILALFRFAITSVTGLFALVGGLALLPVGASWAAFELGGTILFGATPGLGVLMIGAPVVYGRLVAARRDLARAREARAMEAARMEAARSIQLGSLPFDADFSDIGFETAALCRPAQEVGGDFFELFRLSDGRLFAAVGDVSGKGLEASLVTALSKPISGAVTERTPGPLGEALGAVNREFVRQAPRSWREEKGGFVTLCTARIDPETGEAEFAAAGCEPPTVISAAGEIRPLTLPSVAPLGWVPDTAFETAHITLAPGDIVLMFTDGVTEAETPEGTLFGEAEAVTIAARAARGGAKAVLSAMEAAVLAHQHGGAPTDDTTILAIRWVGT